MINNQIISNHPRIINLLTIVKKVAPVNVPVLIMGESGTGKELFARAIHEQSKRADKALVVVNSAAIPAELMESELFGHVKGAFTGAATNRIGKFEEAHHSTIFLDEIGDLHIDAQAKILRTLAEGEIQKVGSSFVQKVDVRIIAATNKDLREDIRRGYFRSDLFYRLNVICLKLPPLRERLEDIPLLIDYFVQLFCERYSKETPEIQPEVVQRLCNHAWEGNIRQLRNTIEQLILLADGKISLDMLPEDLIGDDQSSAGKSLSDRIESVLAKEEKRIIEEMLRRFQNNITRVAYELNITRQTLYRKMEKYGISNYENE